MPQKSDKHVLIYLVLFLLLLFLIVKYELKPVSPKDQIGKAFDPALIQGLVNCMDTDGGVNLQKMGRTFYKGEKIGSQDLCMSSTQLLEASCQNGNVVSELMTCPAGTVCNQNECVQPDQVYICGNGVCENDREIKSGCNHDCGTKCIGKYCNQNINLYCGCKEDTYALLTRLSPCKAVVCEDCNKQSALFNAFYDMQSQVYDCLADYFQYQPPRIPNLVVYDENNEYCEYKNGCTGAETGGSTPVGLIWKPLPGAMSYKENQPTEALQLMADKHETTHYFINQMLHGAPSWFHEAIAIQTNERLNCHPQESIDGDSYLTERKVDLEKNLGINMDDGTYLNDDFYLRWKNGETTLSDQENQNYYIQGVLWVLGLKIDYGCTESCIRDIILELRKYVQEQCKISQDDCGLRRDIFAETTKTCPLKPSSTTSDKKIDVMDIALEKQSVIDVSQIKNRKADLIKDYPLQRADGIRSRSDETSPEQTRQQRRLLRDVTQQKKNSFNLLDNTLKTQLSSGQKPKYWTVWGGTFVITTEKIKEATQNVIGKDVSLLFDKLNLQDQ